MRSMSFMSSYCMSLFRAAVSVIADLIVLLVTYMKI